jgi:hypothetical protein
MTFIRYLCGFSGSDGALLESESNAFLLVDGRYTTQARREAAISESSNTGKNGSHRYDCELRRVSNN